LAAIVVGHVARAYMFSPFIVPTAGKFVPVSNWQLTKVLLPSTACAAVMAGLVLLVKAPVDAALGDRIGLFVVVAIGMAIYAGLAMIFMRDVLRSALGFFARRTV
jgi:hypothetical protein